MSPENKEKNWKIKWLCNNCNNEFESVWDNAGFEKQQHILDCCADLIEDIEE